MTGKPNHFTFWHSGLIIIRGIVITMLAKKSSKNQITLPKSIVASFEGVDYFDVSTHDGHIILEPVHTAQASEVRTF